MNVSRRALVQGQRQLCHRSRVASRSATYWAASPNRASSSQTAASASPAAPASTTAATGAAQAETAKPAEPAKPAAPSKPAAPPKPAAPSKPATPAKPVESAKPAAATTPSKPATPAKSYSKSFSTSSSSKTSSSSSSTAIPSDLFYKPTTVAYAADSNAAVDAASIPAVNWSSSFHGISSKPVTQTQFDALMKPLDVDDIEVKPDGIIYLPEIRYRRRLNEAFGPMGWGLIPKGDAVVGDSIVTREYALIVDGRFVSQAQGENSYFGADQLPSAVEGCKSNALMRCCKDLGIASELWDPSFIRWFKKNRMEEVWVEHATTKKKRTLWYRKGAVDVAYPYRQTK